MALPGHIDQLRALIAAIVPANRFYADRLARAGVDATRLSGLENFAAQVDFTRKCELVEDQRTHPPYGSNFTYPLDDYSRFCQTTGTSGQPLVWLDTAEGWEWLLGNWAHIYSAAGIRRGDRLFFAFSFGPFLGFWTAFEAAAKLGFLCIPGGGMGSEARLRSMILHRATVLLCTPTYAMHLAEVAEERGIDLANSAVQKIIVAGEPGGSIPEVRKRIVEAWNGAQVIDHYGMTEVGPVAFEDPSHPGVLRVIEESYYPEIVDSRGQAVVAGEMGELVLTPLGRIGTPLLRYRTGDLVKQLPGVGGFALDGGIIGRTDDMVVVRGVNIYPSAVDAVVRSIPEIVEYRVQVKASQSMVELKLQIESRTEAAVDALASALGQAFSLRIPVQRVLSGSLPRYELKARRWFRE